MRRVIAMMGVAAVTLIGAPNVTKVTDWRYERGHGGKLPDRAGIDGTSRGRFTIWT